MDWVIDRVGEARCRGALRAQSDAAVSRVEPDGA
jgi:hypothetical protein